MKKLLAFSVLVSFSAVCSYADELGKDRLMLARAQAAKAEKHLDKSKYVEAEKHFRRAIATEPQIATAHLGLGRALVGQHRYAEALVVLAEAEKRFVEWEQAIQIADLVKRQVGERELQSVKDIQAAISDRGNALSGSAPRTPNDTARATPRTIKAEKFLVRERREMQGFEAIPAQVFYLQGVSYLRTNQRSQGIDALETCLLVDNQHELAHYNLAVARFTIGDVDEARAHLDVAIARGVEPHATFVEDLERVLNSRRVAVE